MTCQFHRNSRNCSTERTRWISERNDSWLRWRDENRCTSDLLPLDDRKSTPGSIYRRVCPPSSSFSRYKLEIEHANTDLRVPLQPIVIKNRHPLAACLFLLDFLLSSAIEPSWLDLYPRSDNLMLDRNIILRLSPFRYIHSTFCWNSTIWKKRLDRFTASTILFIDKTRSIFHPCVPVYMCVRVCVYVCVWV